MDPLVGHAAVEVLAGDRQLLAEFVGVLNPQFANEVGVVWF
jgi:hypothetical protein